MKIKGVRWSPFARKDMRSIKEFYDRRNGNSKYSTRLIRLFRQSADLIQKHPFASIETDIENVRGHIVLDYILFFSVEKDGILMLRVWDTRRDPGQIKRFLKGWSGQ